MEIEARIANAKMAENSCNISEKGDYIKAALKAVGRANRNGRHRSGYANFQQLNELTMVRPSTVAHDTVINRLATKGAVAS